MEKHSVKELQELARTIGSLIKFSDNKSVKAMADKLGLSLSEEELTEVEHILYGDPEPRKKPDKTEAEKKKAEDLTKYSMFVGYANTLVSEGLLSQEEADHILAKARKDYGIVSEWAIRFDHE